MAEVEAGPRPAENPARRQVHQAPLFLREVEHVESKLIDVSSRVGLPGDEKDVDSAVCGGSLGRPGRLECVVQNSPRVVRHVDAEVIAILASPRAEPTTECV